ncbi:hypothetical protein [Labrenzia sp. OB1]|uniref:hypothetical protein n=1 Tax=Labrenzia sp. OB1 TaxID=1561204 RepID=UPI0007B2D299|nr:hypothetical protein [Labrenzia sp. OB1]KZM48778.1 hypothetical protein OA90_19070 [Labrenzia sp. OB1]
MTAQTGGKSDEDFCTFRCCALSLSAASQAGTLVMQSVYPSSLAPLGDSGIRLTEPVKALTGGDLPVDGSMSILTGHTAL